MIHCLQQIRRRRSVSWKFNVGRLATRGALRRQTYCAGYEEAHQECRSSRAEPYRNIGGETIFTASRICLEALLLLTALTN